MKKYLSITPLLFFFLFTQKKFGWEKNISAADKWSGKISFSQLIYDTVRGVHYCGWDNDTSWSEWRMEANVINNVATTKSSLNGWKRGGGYDTCMAAWGAIRDTTFAYGNASAELELDVYQGEYGFTVDIPSCTGKRISKRYRNFALTDRIEDEASEGDSQIQVQGQKVGSNPNLLSGKIELHDRQLGRDFVQIWKWNLTKAK